MLHKVISDKDSLLFRVAIVICFIMFAAVVRILPHPWNFTPVGAMAVFSGAKLGRSSRAFVFPCAALFCGDVVSGFHRLMPFVYFSFCVSVLIGIAFRNRQSVLPLSLATLLGAIQFFLITNFAVWAMLGTYPHTFGGLLTCYVAGIPHFRNTLAGDACYALLFFAGYALIERFSPVLRRAGTETPTMSGYGD